MSINTNLNAAAAQRHTARGQSDLATSIARLASGLRINSARDDAAGLAIADRFTTQIRGTNQAARNANDAISLSQTAEGSLGSISDALQRMRELAVQAANATNSAADRASLQLEVTQLVSEIDRIATQTQFNGINLIDGSFAGKALQVGANVDQSILVGSIPSARSKALGQFQGVLLASQAIGYAWSSSNVLTVNIGGTSTSLGSVINDAKAIAAAINAGNITGLTATANPTVVADGPFFGPSGTVAGTATFTLNGVAIPIYGVPGGIPQGAVAQNRTNAVTAINAQTAATGVVATETSKGVRLEAADGRNVYINYNAGSFTNSSASDFGLSQDISTGGTVAIRYVAPKGVTGNLSFTQNSITGSNQGFTNSTAIGAVGPGLSALDISTLTGATAALETVDLAMAGINSSRAALGALQNRFASTIDSLARNGENLSSARSRILDADFAMETAQMSRAQVMQEAGTAMIAQANQIPQQVLKLLR